MTLEQSKNWQQWIQSLTACQLTSIMSGHFTTHLLDLCMPDSRNTQLFCIIMYYINFCCILVYINQQNALQNLLMKRGCLEC